MPIFIVDVRQDLVYAYGWSSRLVRLFWRSNEPRSEHTPYFDDFRVLCHTIFCVIRIPTTKMPNVFVDICQDLVYAYGCPSQLVRPICKVKRASKRAYHSFQRFSCAIAHHFLGVPDSDVKHAKFFRGRTSRPCLCIRLSITACPTDLKGQTSPEASIPLISMISCAIAHHFLGDQDFYVKSSNHFCGRS